MTAVETVAAAGGVVWRGRNGDLEVGLVHRARYDDWSLPKGKLDDGESAMQGAVREVAEELGARVAVSRRIGRVRYQVGTVDKGVTYWAMRYLEGRFEPNDEVDEVQWLPPAEARRRLTYSADRRMVADFAALPAPDTVIALVRHAKAGRRSDWPGEDTLRPLDATGARQAEQLAGLLSCLAPRTLVSAEPTRCVQTLQPLADRLGLPIRVDRAFSDRAYSSDPQATEAALLALAEAGAVSVVCSQGGAIPGLLASLGPAGISTETGKGAVWVLSVLDGQVIAADYYRDPDARA